MIYIKSFNVPEPPQMGEKPDIDKTAVIADSSLGVYTSVGPFTELFECSVGDYTYMMQNCQMQYSEIGKFCSIASYVRLHPVNHPTWRPTTHHMTYRRKSYGLGETDDEDFFDWRRGSKVVIGHDVWLGHNVVVRAGVSIGHGAVVGSSSVVTKDIPPYAIAVGNPARVIKYRFEPDVIEKLLEIQWWDWPYDTHKERLPHLMDMDRLLADFG